METWFTNAAFIKNLLSSCLLLHPVLCCRSLRSSPSFILSLQSDHKHFSTLPPTVTLVLVSLSSSCLHMISTCSFKAFYFCWFSISSSFSSTLSISPYGPISPLFFHHAQAEECTPLASLKKQVLHFYNSFFPNYYQRPSPSLRGPTSSYRLSVSIKINQFVHHCGCAFYLNIYLKVVIL